MVCFIEFKKIPSLSPRRQSYNTFYMNINTYSLSYLFIAHIVIYQGLQEMILGEGVQ